MHSQIFGLGLCLSLSLGVVSIPPRLGSVLVVVKVVYVTRCTRGQDQWRVRVSPPTPQPWMLLMWPAYRKIEEEEKKRKAFLVLKNDLMLLKLKVLACFWWGDLRSYVVVVCIPASGFSENTEHIYPQMRKTAGFSSREVYVKPRKQE